MSNVILTTSGASFMATAGTMFPALPIKYALFSYDYRIDPYVLPTSGLTLISAADTVSAVGLTQCGDVIYNVESIGTSAYTITNNEFLLRDANQSGTTTITNNRFDGTSVITLLNGRPLSHSISATSIVYSYPNWTVNGYTMVSGSNPVPTGYASDLDKYFRVTSFAPISCAAGGNSRGLFKVLIDNTQGNFKFNKILLYAARILSGGVEDTSIPPVLVGIAYLNRPVIKSNDGSNLNFFEADIEVEFSANNYFGNVSFLPNDNWNWVAGERILWQDAKIAIGTSGLPNSWYAQAKLHISETNPEIPLIRLTTDNDTIFVDTILDDSAFAVFEKHKGSRSEILFYVETSGTDEFSRILLRGNTNDFYRTIDMRYSGSVSGTVRSGFEATYGGYLEQFDTYVNGQYLSTFRSNDDGAYGTLVLGKDSLNLFEHRNKFLTLHGGAAFIGNAGLLVSGSSSSLIPCVSANGWIESYGVAVESLEVNDSAVFQNGAVILNDTSLDNVSVGGTAHFYDRITFDGIISGGSNITTHSLNVSGYFKVVDDATFYGDVYISEFIQADSGSFGSGNVTNAWTVYGDSYVGGTFEAAGSATFSNPVRFNDKIYASTSVSALGDIFSNGGYFELSRQEQMGYWYQYSPTVSADAGTTVSTSETYFGYMLIGKTMFIEFSFSVAISVSDTSNLILRFPGEYSTLNFVMGAINYLSFPVVIHKLTSDTEELGRIIVNSNANKFYINKLLSNDVFDPGSTYYIKGSFFVEIP